MKDATSNFTPQRLLQLRHLEGLTQRELAESLGVSQALISGCERGTKTLPSTAIDRLYTEYSYPESFFTDLPSSISGCSSTFRKKASTSQREINYTTALLQEVSGLYTTLGQTIQSIPFEPPAPDCIEAVSRKLRLHNNLSPTEPIRNMTRFLERLGIAVVRNLGTGVNVDGLSLPNSGSYPVIFASHNLPGDRQRFTLAHELAHLIYDTEGKGDEARAHAFAGALLLPEEIARAEISESLTLFGYGRLKSNYGISIGAAIQRGKQLNLISDRRFRSLRIQISSKGWNTSEPGEVTKEPPVLLKQAVTYAEGTSLSSEWKRVPPSLLNRWIEREPEFPNPPANVIPFPKGTNNVY